MQNYNFTYGWYLTLREVHGRRVFESRILTRIFGPKRDEVTGGWNKLHCEELHNLYSLPSIIRMIMIRKMRLARHVVQIERREIGTGYWWESRKEGTIKKTGTWVGRFY
jgi:hypothetical protein